MEQIENAGLLRLILRNLEHLEDFISCSAVSRGWCKQVQVVRLRIGSADTQQLQNGFRKDDRRTVSGVTRWLHFARDQGMLRDLSSLSVSAPLGPLPATPMLSDSAYMLDNVCLECASLCPLKTCHIQNFTNSLTNIIAKLPLALQSISLQVEVAMSPKDIVSLRPFGNFTQLTTLHMSTSKMHAVDTEYLLDVDFTCLEELKLSDGMLIIDASVRVAYALCNLRFLTVTLRGSQQEVQAVLDLPLLQVLMLGWHDDMAPFRDDQIALTVQPPSSLQSLTLLLADTHRLSNGELAVTLQIAKPGMNLTCENILVNAPPAS